MGSLGTGELIVIAIAALVVFGPKRLPELARKAGELLAKARTATRSLSDSLDGDYGEIAAPLQTLKSEYDATVKEIKNVGTTVTGLGTTLPGEDVADPVDGSQSTVDGTEEEADGEEAVDGQKTVDGRQSTVDGTEEEEASDKTVDGQKTVDGSQSTVDSTEEEEAGEETVNGGEAGDGSQSTVDSTEEEAGISQGGAGESDTVDRLPSTDDSDDRESS